MHNTTQGDKKNVMRSDEIDNGQITMKLSERILGKNNQKKYYEKSLNMEHVWDRNKIGRVRTIKEGIMKVSLQVRRKQTGKKDQAQKKEKQYFSLNWYVSSQKAN